MKTPIASELAYKAAQDSTVYKAREVAEAWSEGLITQLLESAQLYEDKIDQNEFCIVYVIAGDPLLPTLRRRKFYCWPYLPSPRPDQGVFLYNKSLQRITKRLWILPNAMSMAELAQPGLVADKNYKSMQRWSKSFFKGTFWQDIRREHDIKMLSQEEFDELNKAELVKRGLENPDADTPQPFDFSKITAGQVESTADTLAPQNA